MIENIPDDLGSQVLEGSKKIAEKMRRLSRILALEEPQELGFQSF